MFPMLRVGFVLLFGTIMLAPMRAQPLTEAAAPLATRIVSLLPQSATVSLDFAQLTPQAITEWPGFRAEFEQQLRKAGIQTTAGTQPEPGVRVTLAANTRGLLLVADVRQAGSRQVIMLPWSYTVSKETNRAVRLTMSPVLEQQEPILDLLLLGANQLLVLTPAAITSFRQVNGKWMFDGRSFLNLAQPLSRDPRGRLALAAEVVRAYLPGNTCSGPLQQLSMTCSSSNDSWPLSPRDVVNPVHWTTGRNVMESDVVRGAFYSAAGGLFASSSGKIEDRTGETLQGTERWGSDIVALQSPCGASTTVVAAMAGTAGDTDQVEAFDVSARQPLTLSDPLSLAGAVTALWPAETAAQATIVVHNSKTGTYEASRLALACTE